MTGQRYQSGNGLIYFVQSEDGDYYVFSANTVLRRLPWGHFKRKCDAQAELDTIASVRGYWATDAMPALNLKGSRSRPPIRAGWSRHAEHLDEWWAAIKPVLPATYKRIGSVTGWTKTQTLERVACCLELGKMHISRGSGWDAYWEEGDGDTVMEGFKG